MTTKILSFLGVFFIASIVYSQQELYSALSIPSELKSKANAVVRYNDQKIEVKAYNEILFTQKRIVTVLSKAGNSDVDAIFHYERGVEIKNLEVKIFDAYGKELKKIKEKDFQDVSAVSGGTLYSDSRIKYLDYTPVSYPYTVLLDVEIEYNSTAFLPGWRPIEGYYVSTENSEYEIVNSSEVEIKIKTENFENYNIIKLNDFHYKASGLMSLKPEAYSPGFKTFAPVLKAALVEFDMVGVKGVNNNWLEFGKWTYDKLLTGTDPLPENVKQEIKALTNGVDDKIEKAKIVYKYVQDKTRYISVQVGIGGWKPMLASDVDRLGYGDCKGLSNYTRSLLKEVGVESYYALIYGGRGILNIDREFSAQQGNHAVLYIPNNDSGIWLECTSQTNPFGFIAGFTDDRDALIVTPEGGEIIHTTAYSKEESKQVTNAKVKIFNDGSLKGEVAIETQGYQYALHEGVQNKDPRDQDLYFKNYWDYVNNLSIDEMEFENDKDSILFTENIKVSAQNYASKTGNLLLVNPNIFNRVTHIPTRYRNRTLDFEIERGFVDTDEFIIEIDESLSFEAIPEAVTIDTKYGFYQFSITKLNDHEILYQRTYSLNKGNYPKEEYDKFRDFKASVVKNDKAKLALTLKL
ncbi:DUF3857 domain-containing protein [Mangrovimonas sp. TPBH4]|uniref:DUF3857 domain-containing protein n=1 Tax=Mangrovimonas sp. TPBH4 TaxID=1645914 RepID=UPI0009EC8DCC|nr:DUF3857 domain-containing protein [Mangrovimonas sp. TPBH4]